MVRARRSYRSTDRGVYNVFVWSGNGTYGGVAVTGGTAGQDELLVTHDRAVAGVEVRNTGPRICS